MSTPSFGLFTPALALNGNTSINFVQSDKKASGRQGIAYEVVLITGLAIYLSY